jgi:nitrogen fixation NifU-like protein
MPTYSDDILRLAETTPIDIAAGAPVAEAANRLCGDKVKVSLDTRGDLITQVHWHVEGCAILRASAAYLARSLTEKTIPESAEIIRSFSESFELENSFRQGPLAAVYKLPARYKCALLPWQAAKDFLSELKR